MVQSPSFQQSRTIEGGVRRIEGWIDGETQEKISLDQRILILLKIREIPWMSIKLRIQNLPNYWNVDERPELRRKSFPSEFCGCYAGALPSEAINGYFLQYVFCAGNKNVSGTVLPALLSFLLTTMITATLFP
jgi:hypothetical protein